MYIRTEAIEVPPEEVVELDPSRTYISTYLDDPATGKNSCSKAFPKGLAFKRYFGTGVFVYSSTPKKYPNLSATA